MANIAKLPGLLRQAKKEGWDRFIRTPVDEKALLLNHTFSFPHYDHFRFYVENFIKLTKGRWSGQPMELLPWHDLVCGSLFGWIKPDGLRRFRRGYIEVPKKNSKTTLCAAIGLYMLNGDGEDSSEVYTCANEKDQAGILWGIAADAVEASPDLNSKMEITRSTKRIVLDAKSWFAAWSSDKSGKDGQNAHCILVDELHEWKGAIAREFWGKIRYAGIARDQPLCPLVITTAGDDRYSLCWEQRTAAKRVLEGTSEDLALFAAIWGANEKKIKEDLDYWKKEECWKEANPSYGLILKKDDFESDVVEVENDPTAKARFFRYRIGVWTESDTPWISAHDWNKNAGEPFTEEDLRGQLCFTGLDLSSVDDFTSFNHVFPYLTSRMEIVNGEEVRKTIKKFKTIARVYCPEDTFSQRIRRDDTGSLRVWHEQGYIRLTPGNAIDHEFIFNEILADSEKFQIKNMAYDRNSAAWIVQEIEKKLPHIELFPFNQSMTGMSTPTKSLKAALLTGRIEHNNNPVLAWAASNAVVETDANENERLHKGKSRDKIDPAVAFIMGYNQAELGSMSLEKKFSPYSDEGFKVIKELEGIKDDK